MHKRIVRFSRWVHFLITRFTQIDIVSSRATGTTSERGGEAKGAPLKPHFRRIDFQVLHEREKLVCNSRFVLISSHMASSTVKFSRRFQYNIDLFRVHISSFVIICIPY